MAIEDRQSEAYIKKEVLKQIYHVDVSDIDELFVRWDKQYEADDNDMFETMGEIEDEITKLCNERMIIESSLSDHSDDIQEY